MRLQTPVKPNQAHLRSQTPQDREPRPLQDSHGTQFAIVIGGVFIAIALVFSQQVIGCIAVLFAAFALAWPFEQGPGYTYWRIWYADIRLLRNGTLPTNREGYVIDCEVGDILGQFGTLYDRRVNTDKVFFSFSGFKHANDDPEQRHQADTLITEIVKTALAQTEEDLVLGPILGERPDDPTAWANHIEDHYVSPEYRGAKSHIRDFVRTDPDGVGKILASLEAHPERRLRGADAKAFQHENVGAAWNGIEQRGAKYWRIIYLCLERPPEWQAIRSNDPSAFTAEMLRNTPLFRVFTALKQGLETAGFMDVKMMTHEEIESFVFSTWNARTNPEARASKHPTSVKQNIPEGGDTYSAFPLQPLQATRNYLVTDGVHHTSLVVTKFGKKYVMPGGMFALQAGLPRWTMMSARVATASAGRDTLALRYKKNQRQANIKRRYGNGYIPEQKDRDLAEEDANRVDAVYRSGSRSVRISVTFVVSATSPQELEARVEDLKAILRGQLIKVRRERHPALQLKRFKSIWGAES